MKKSYTLKELKKMNTERLKELFNTTSSGKLADRIDKILASRGR